jgi:hypothetical protein
MLEERSERRDVVSWELIFEERTTRRRSWNHSREESEVEVMSPPRVGCVKEPEAKPIRAV